MKTLFILPLFILLSNVGLGQDHKNTGNKQLNDLDPQEYHKDLKPSFVPVDQESIDNSPYDRFNRIKESSKPGRFDMDEKIHKEDWIHLRVYYPCRSDK